MERRIEPLKTIGRILAIDYGEKRIGLALSDPLKMFAKPYRVLENSGMDSFIAELKEIIPAQSVELVVFGIPYAIEGGNTAKTDETIAVLEVLRQHLTTEIIGWDERYTSSEANAELKKMGYSWQEARSLVDAMAAAMILKDYLNAKN
ncbi:MAG TPA: Holliday junction resolvase RuvX [Candidatus Cloacimonadota bacterium]|nr:Holliday junction resolvase RuvX [Candidatus Cloacimonadota bacterium]HPS39820.1 Holliday junction resolvase RuvX [Candidatus Cloacimonadota bacterium]